jgi:hypothetical protein
MVKSTEIIFKRKSMKEGIRNLLLYILIFYFVVSVFTGIVLPMNLLYVLATLVILSLAMMIAKPLLNFLTVKANFITLLLVGSLLVFSSMLLLESLMPGFGVENDIFAGVTFGSIVINDFEMSPMATMAGSSVLGAFLCSLFHELDRN